MLTRRLALAVPTIAFLAAMGCSASPGSTPEVASPAWAAHDASPVHVSVVPDAVRAMALHQIAASVADGSATRWTGATLGASVIPFYPPGGTAPNAYELE